MLNFNNEIWCEWKTKAISIQFIEHDFSGWLSYSRVLIHKLIQINLLLSTVCTILSYNQIYIVVASFRWVNFSSSHIIQLMRNIWKWKMKTKKKSSNRKKSKSKIGDFNNMHHWFYCHTSKVERKKRTQPKWMTNGGGQQHEYNAAIVL